MKKVVRGHSQVFDPAGQYCESKQEKKSGSKIEDIPGYLNKHRTEPNSTVTTARFHFVGCNIVIYFFARTTL